ncbi:MAG: family 43 glycosylhydrolase, partial [Acetatifactor sp.]|nr:family 43 glycosylhydrolase [Acetatifactor sp.]
TLDMTCFEWQGEHYAVWSQRQFLPNDLGAWLYIAKLNPQEPWKLQSDPVVLSKPEYGWANNHTFVDEGPFALVTEDKLYLTFSSAAVDTSYVVGLLTVEKGRDLLDVHNWHKKNYPILTSRSVEGEFGTGHNAYVIDDNKTVWNTYHARPGVNGVRSSGIRRVHFDIEGEPVLDLTEEMDLKEEYSKVKTRLTVTE